MSIRRVALHGILGAAFGLIFVGGSGCGGGGGGGNGGTGGGGGGAGGTGGGGSTLYRPCTSSTLLGGFLVELLADSSTTAFTGGVRDAVLPGNVWPQIAAAGECRLITGPTLTCAPSCPNPQICAGQNQCIAEPRLRSVGNVTLTGIGSAPTVAMPTAAQYYVSIANPYPPAPAGANLMMVAAGGDLPGFTLTGRGIDPLVVGSAPLTVMGGQPFSFTWTPKSGAAKISASLDIAHHGGVAARIECEFDDDGSGEMPATLIDQLIDQGVAGFPELTLMRRTLDSTTISAGCVEFQVASVVRTQVTLCPTPGSCVVSCADDTGCQPPQTCKKPDSICVNP